MGLRSPFELLSKELSEVVCVLAFLFEYFELKILILLMAETCR